MSGISTSFVYVVESDGSDAFPVGAKFPIFEEKKPFFMVYINGSCVKVMRATMRFPKVRDGVLFSLSAPAPVEPLRENNDVTDEVTVTETPKRKRGRPVTGKAMTAAEKQAAYRLRQRQKSVTVTISRGLLEYLDAQMVCIMEGRSLDILTPEQAEELHAAIRRASLVQLPPVDGEPREP